jgi:hypothetical protein
MKTELEGDSRFARCEESEFSPLGGELISGVSFKK